MNLLIIGKMLLLLYMEMARMCLFLVGGIMKLHDKQEPFDTTELNKFTTSTQDTVNRFKQWTGV